MARFEVTISEMQSTASKIAQAAENFREAAAQVLASAQQLGESWEGDSQVAFMEEQAKANQWYNNMMTIVNDYVAKLQNAAKSYQEADEQSAATIKAQ